MRGKGGEGEGEKPDLWGQECAAIPRSHQNGGGSGVLCPSDAKLEQPTPHICSPHRNASTAKGIRGQKWAQKGFFGWFGWFLLLYLGKQNPMGTKPRSLSPMLCAQLTLFFNYSSSCRLEKLAKERFNPKCLLFARISPPPGNEEQEAAHAMAR